MEKSAASTEEPNEKPTTENEYPYHALSPINNADDDGHYSTALNWALKNREKEDIRNIALTGPYGSGKSSILKTFEKNNEDPDLVFLNISLATFKEDKKPSMESNHESPEDNHILWLIELSILQQIFYHEEDESIPDTRFKKTRSFPAKKVKRIAIAVFVFAISLLYQIFPGSLKKLLKFSLDGWIETTLHYLTLVVVAIGSFYFLYSSIRPLRNIRLKKFNFQDAEFDLDDNISKSILNDHLDEILYFFEVTEYTVVIIEDLDRFEQTEIFTKLRELNHLINYSKKTKRKVTFIYAVRDDMFQDKDRTKFFDFIIPVIPVINSSNSNEILLKIVKENNYPIEPDLLESISLFVDDMRLLYNIMNEYHLYRKKLDDKLDQNKLLATIVYKNIFPNDFVNLSNSGGDLYQAIHQKGDLIKERLLQLDQRIEELNKEISGLSTIGIKNADELRMLYVLRYAVGIQNFNGFGVDKVSYSYQQMATAELFKYFQENKVTYSYKDPYNRTLFKTINLRFNEIEKQVDSVYSYKQRLEQIESYNNDRIEHIKKEIAQIKHDGRTLKQQTIKQLLENENLSVEVENHKQLQLISILLRFGHIDENYLDYISIFYEGSITRTDKDFLLNVKAHLPTDFSHRLNKIDKLIPKIPVNEFRNEYILNFDLVRYMLDSSGYQVLLKDIFTKLADESDRSVSFVDGFVFADEHADKFIVELASRWPNMWKYLNLYSEYTRERISEYFILIMRFVDVDTIKTLAQNSDLQNYIAERSDLLQLPIEAERLKQIISSLDIHFDEPDYSNVDESLLQFIFEGSYYKINHYNLYYWFQKHGVFSSTDFEGQNYTSIRKQFSNPKTKKIKEYIGRNLTSYLKEVWLKMPTPQSESPIYLKDLLNKDIALELKEEILSFNTSKIRDIGQLEEEEIVDLVIERNMMEPTWHNVITYYKLKQSTIDELLISFLDDEENYGELSKTILPLPEDENEKQTVVKFINACYITEELTTSAYQALIQSMTWNINYDLDFSNLSREKVEILIAAGKLNVTQQNYFMLREHHQPLHINLIERDPAKFVKEADVFSCENSDIPAILKSVKFTLEQKTAILSRFSDQQIVTHQPILIELGSLLAQNIKITDSSTVISAILQSSLPSKILVQIYINNHMLFNKVDFYHIVSHWADPFNNIQPTGKKPVIPEDNGYWQFANLLYEQGYTYKPNKDKRGIRINNLKAE